MNTTKEKNTQTYPDILWLSWADWDRYASTISNSGRLRESNDDIEGFTNQKRDIYSENEDQSSMMGIRLLFGSVWT